MIRWEDVPDRFNDGNGIWVKRKRLVIQKLERNEYLFTEAVFEMVKGYPDLKVALYRAIFENQIKEIIK